MFIGPYMFKYFCLFCIIVLYYVLLLLFSFCIMYSVLVLITKTSCNCACMEPAVLNICSHRWHEAVALNSVKLVIHYSRIE